MTATDIDLVPRNVCWGQGSTGGSSHARIRHGRVRLDRLRRRARTHRRRPSGHGLARSDASAAALAAAGAQVHRGTLDDLGSLRSAADASDGVIHLAFKHDVAFSGGFQDAAEADRRAIETFGEALAGSGRPFIIASGTLGIAPGRLATERDDGHGPGSVGGVCRAAARRCGWPMRR